MNDFVLRGFCKKCGIDTRFGMSNEHKWHEDPIGDDCDGLFEWFLSPKQIRIILFSDKFEKWAESSNRSGTLLSIFLEKEPFLVAKILKEAGEKEGENK